MGSLLGLGGAGAAAIFTDLRPYLVLFAVGSLGYAHYRVYVRGEGRARARFLWLSTLLAALFISAPYFLTGDWELLPF